MKKILTSIITLCILLTFCLTSYAATPKGLLVLGDSISTGYGLPSYVGGNRNDVMSFGNLLAEFLGYKENGGYKNTAIDGQTSEGLLWSITKNPEETEGYDYISLSIGGNDLLDSLLPAVISAITELSGGSYRESDLRERLGILKEKIGGGINTALINASENIDEILKLLREKNPNSFIAIQTIYNPFDILNKKGYLSYINSILISPYIKALNENIIKSAKKYRIYVIDTNREFEKSPAKFTNIQKGDIHPSAEGHMKIYELMQGAIAHFKAKSHGN